MAYNITEGWYKVWNDFTLSDGSTYTYTTIIPLVISNDLPTSETQIVGDGGITADGQKILDIVKVNGLVNTYPLAFKFSDEVTEDSFNTTRIRIINTASIIGVSISLPKVFGALYETTSSVPFKTYLDEKRTKLLIEGNFYLGYSYTPYDLLSAWGLYYAYGYHTSLSIPVIVVPTDLSRSYAGRITCGTTAMYWEYSDESRYNKIALFDGLEPFVEDTDPYSKGGDSETGGGTGDFDGTSDDIAIPELPTLSATSTNFITLFNPSLGELQNLANYMWSDLFDLDTFKKIFADPMDCILGLSIVPVAVPSGGSKAVTVGNISTGVTMQVASAQYVSVDCGTLNVNEYWGAYLDYDPYTKAEIYLPYIGTHPIAVDDIMGKAVHVVYHVDILSGACTAYVQCGGSVLYSFIGQCSASIPITGNDWTNVINGVLSIAGSIGSMVATGGMSAPLAVTAGASLASTAINSMKPSVEKSGSMSGVGGMLAVQTPYIILTRPRQARPKQQNTYTGYPSFITSKLSKLTGYTEIEVIHMDGLTCTDSEATEIENLLKGGVIF